MASGKRVSKRGQKTDHDVQAQHYCERGIDPSGFVKVHINDKIGYGIFTTKSFLKEEFLLQYSGDLITKKEAEVRERRYKKENKGCFLYFVMVGKIEMCIDATNGTRDGKFVNDSPNSFCNSIMRVKVFNDKPYLCLYAAKDISSGTELRYNYNDKGMEWRKNNQFREPFHLSNICGHQAKNPNEGVIDFAVQWSDRGSVICIDDECKREEHAVIVAKGNGAVEKGNAAIMKEGNGTVVRESNGVVVDGNGVVVDGNGAVVEGNSAVVEVNGVVMEGNGVVVKDNGAVVEEGNGVVVEGGNGTVVGEGNGVVVEEDDGVVEKRNVVVGESNGVIVEEGNGVVVGEGNGVLVEEGNGVVVEEGNGVIVEKGNGVVVEVGNGVEVEEGNGVEVEEGNGVGVVVEEGNGVLVEEGNGIVVEGNGVIVQEDDGVVKKGNSVAVEGNSVVVEVGNGVVVEEGNGVIVEEGNSVVVEVGNGVEVEEGNGVEVEEGNGVEVEEGNGVIVEKRNGVEVEEGNGVVVEEGNGVVEKSNAMVVESNGAVVEGNGVVVEGNGVVVGEGNSVDDISSERTDDVKEDLKQTENYDVNDVDMNHYAELIRKNFNDVDKIKDVLGEFAQTIAHSQTNNNENSSLKRKGPSIESHGTKKAYTKNQAVEESEDCSVSEESANTKRFKCPECQKSLKSKLKRHMVSVHNWSENRAKSALLYNKYQPNSNFITSGGRKTKGGKTDYHILKICPYEFCHVVRQRLGPHLVDKHKLVMGSEDYQRQLKNATPWKGIVDKTKRDESRRCLQRETIRDDFDNQPILPIFTESLEGNSVYIPRSQVAHTPVPFQGGTVPDSSPEKLVANEDVMKMFYSFMSSLEGGDLERTSAELYVQEVRLVLKSLQTDDFTTLFNRKKMNESFLNKRSDNPSYQYKPSTKQKYLTALMHFCDFCSNSSCPLNLLQITRDDIVGMRQTYYNWRKSLNKQVQLNESVRNEDELEAMILPEQVKLWQSGERKREAIKFLAEFSSQNPPVLTQTKYCTMRDYFFVEIALQNSHRSGVSSNLTVDEFEGSNSESVEDTELMMVKVKKHKTVRSHGYAKLYLSLYLHQNLKIFVRDVRSQLPGNDPHVFLSFTGRQMTSGEVSTQINSIWQRSGVYGCNPKPKKNITCTQFRKSVSTLVLEHNPEASKSVADLLAHGSSTQQKYYDVRRRDKSSAVGALNVGRLLRGENKDQERQEPVVENNIQSSPSKKKWTIAEIQELMSVFNTLLNSDSSFTIDDVRQESKGFILLKGITFKKIYDKLRSLRRYKPKSTSAAIQPPQESSTKEETVQAFIDTAEDPTSSDDEFIPPSRSSCTSGKEKKFSEDKVRILKKVLGHVIPIGPRTAKSIRPLLDQTEQGKQLLEEFGIDAIVNRAKYEKKMLPAKKSFLVDE